MSSHAPRIDAYIARRAEVARPILERIRAILHEACPEAEEKLKWSAPGFVYAGGIHRRSRRISPPPKREETRQKRLPQTVEWLAEGKSRNWKCVELLNVSAA